MAQIISIANQKGGVGKSTATLLAATALSQPPFSYDVAVLDVDPQQSISRRREDDLKVFSDPVPFVVYQSTSNFKKDIKALSKRHQIIFLDLPGKLDTEAGKDSEAVQALLYLDFVFVPFTPGNFTMDATLDYIKIAEKVQAENRPDLRLVAFRNMHRERSRHGRQLADELADLSRFVNVLVMEAPLKRYSDFEDADSITSLYSPGSSSPARQNFTAWLDELDTLITK